MSLKNNFTPEEIEIVDDIWTVIQNNNSFIILGHSNPDGDTIGSTFSLYKILTDLGKNAYPCLGDNSSIPQQYSFLPQLENYTSPKHFPDQAVVITVDCTSFERLGSLQSRMQSYPYVINIDHHHDNKKFGHINYVGDQFSSTSEVLYRMYKRWNVTIDKDVALHLYTGIVTDTGRFQYKNTEEDTMVIASDLISKGVVPNYVFEKVYETLSYSALKLMGTTIKNTCYLKDISVIYTTISQAELKETGVPLAETESFIDLIRLVDGANIAACFKEMQDGSIRASLRSKFDVDVSKVAREFGGGGHKNASGFSTNGPMISAVEAFVSAVQNIIYKNKIIVNPHKDCIH